MKSASTIRSHVTEALGLLAVALSLALSLPGVHAVRADESDMTPVSAADYSTYVSDPDPAPRLAAQPPASPGAEACGDPAAERANRKAHEQLLARIPQPRPGEAGVEAQPGVILLNNRGFNYGAGEGPNEAQYQRLERELLAQPE